jgi:hypothetical protein
MTTCFECDDTGVCDCIICGYDGFDEDARVTRKAGPCVDCRARAFQRRHAGVLRNADPADRNNWEWHPPADGNKGYRVYLPTKGLR